VQLHRIHAVSRRSDESDIAIDQHGHLQRSDELGSPSKSAFRSRVCQTTTAAKASTEKSAKVKTTFIVARSDRSAITLAPITNATMTVLIAVNTRPAVSKAAAAHARF
jgi:hypothetical protein